MVVVGGGGQDQGNSSDMLLKSTQKVMLPLPLKFKMNYNINTVANQFYFAVVQIISTLYPKQTC